jgi:hypothetical protein
MSRDTTTGRTYEKKIYFLFEQLNYSFRRQVNIGRKRNGGRHIIDLIEGKTLISLKNQTVAGTAEEKVPFEVMKLQHAIDDYGYDDAIIVLNGDSGWTWKDYYLSNEFQESMSILYPKVKIMSHEQFIKKYNLHV